MEVAPLKLRLRGPAGWGIAALIAVLAGVVHADEIVVYSYHNHPPFITGEGKGLSHELVHFLNRHADEGMRFRLEILPRTRLAGVMARPDFGGVVAWVSPLWFGDGDRTRYLWSRPLMEDANVVLSAVKRRHDYTRPESLKGLVFGGILGHRYAGIDDMVTQGAIRREDVTRERSNLLKLDAGRIDVTLLPASTTHFLLDDMSLAERIHVSATPHSTYSRRILVSTARPDIYAFINRAVTAMETDRSWQALLFQHKVGTPSR
ncbi:MAG TPA: hypothetical protein VGE12_15905 [Noviherbaspirillum sp.]